MSIDANELRQAVFGDDDTDLQAVASEVRSQIAAAVPVAVSSITQLCRNADTEKLRFEAAKFIINFVLGQGAATADGGGGTLNLGLKFLPGEVVGDAGGSGGSPVISTEHAEIEVPARRSRASADSHPSTNPPGYLGGGTQVQ